jgi:hypothetical protein
MRGMARAWPGLVLLALGALIAFPDAVASQQESSPAASSSPPISSPLDTSDPHTLFRQLNELRVDSSKVYTVHELSLGRDVARFTFMEGTLAFLQAVDGRISGAVFTGHGHVIALPHEAGERRSLVRYLGVPILDQTFSKAYLRFTDDSAAELLRQINSDGVDVVAKPEFAEQWDKLAPALAPTHSLRIMVDWLASEPAPYFYALLEGDQTGTFEVLVDPRREEEVLIGQTHLTASGPTYDTWASFHSRETSAGAKQTFVPVSYAVDSTIGEDLSLDGKTTVKLKAVRAGERVVALELSRNLAVKQVELDDGRALPFFQNADMGVRDALKLGNDMVLVVLPEAAPEGREFNVAAEYKGSVIADAGNGVKYVGERGAWYAHTGGIDFVPFELTFRWPKRLTLVATGTNVETRDEGEWKTGRWRSGQPFSVAGFNLGEYKSAAVAGPPEVAVFANSQLENAISEKIKANTATAETMVGNSADAPNPDPYSIPREQPPAMASIPPSPANVLKQLGRDVADSVQYFEKINGAYPFDHLNVAQIPGMFGQGWPELVYLSTYAFLPDETQHLAGMNDWGIHEARELMPFHEVAHQWWGNVAAAQSYRDAWLQEGMANYLALRYADSRKPGEHRMARWLEHYRTELLSKDPGSNQELNDAGPLSLGARLVSMQQPHAYDVIVYGKGTWVIDMLAEMFHDPNAKDPDGTFDVLLQDVLKQYRFRAISTADFERIAEHHMTPSMDLEQSGRLSWFFDEWVNRARIPSYSITFNTKPRGREFQISGTIVQEGVDDTFTERVPLYISRTGSKPEMLGDVITTGPETSFRFIAKFRPNKVVIDPNHTILCVLK